MAVWRVALPVAGSEVYDYRPPAGWSGAAPLGHALRVPFGRRELVGIVMDSAADSAVPAAKLRAATAVLGEAPLLDAPLRALLEFAARHYLHPLGLCVATALPAQAHRAPRRVHHYQITAAGQATLAAGRPRGARQRAVLEQLAAAPEGCAREALHAPATVLSRLVAQGWAEVSQRCDDVAPHSPGAEPATLRSGQQQALEAIRGAGSRPQLLIGPTGSGKTEVYLARAAEVIAAGQQVLMLVPEIALTPQMIARVRARLRARVGVLHSGLPDGARHALWHAAASGEADFVLATRSGVFTPLPRLGLLIVDEEHEASYKQQDGLRYSARDLAVYRGQLQDCAVLLGSATPSLESLHNATQGRYVEHSLPAPQRGQQDLRLVDLRPLPAAEPLSPALRALMREHLDAQGQCFLFLNRRGYAPVLYCPECQWSPQCARCDSAMVWHRGAGELRCHHCDSRQRPPTGCASCDGSQLLPVGWGTQRVVEAAERAFPDTPVLRFDRDSLGQRGALESALEDIAQRRAPIVVGTQMLAKGHDFPALSLVAVVDADGGLYSADFRATERLGQLLSQVRGRAGRRAQDAACVIQTRAPTHPHLQAWLAGGYGGLSQALLAERAEAGWPPYAHVALLRIEAPESAALEAFWQALEPGRWQAEGVDLLGPVSRPRRAGRERAQLLWRASRRGQLHPLLRQLRATLQDARWARSVRWAFDVDPWTLD